MPFLYIFMAVVIAAVVFWWWEGVSSLNALERGAHGPFKVTRVSGAGDSYFAVDSGAKKLALVNVGVPQYSARGDITSYINMTVVFSFADLASVSVALKEEVASAVFSFVKPVPPWNLDKQLTYVSGEGIRIFLRSTSLK